MKQPGHGGITHPGYWKDGPSSYRVTPFANHSVCLYVDNILRFASRVCLLPGLWVFLRYLDFSNAALFLARCAARAAFSRVCVHCVVLFVN